MKGYFLGYHNQNFVFSSDISIGIPESGFSFQIGKTGDPFYPVVQFSGVSGYIFDQSGHFVGGYKKDVPFSISGSYFFGDVTQNNQLITDDNATGRLSYYIDDILIANNINGPTGFFDTILFEDYGGLNSINLEVIKETGSPNAIMDNDGIYLLSSEGYYLVDSQS